MKRTNTKASQALKLAHKSKSNFRTWSDALKAAWARINALAKGLLKQGDKISAQKRVGQYENEDGIASCGGWINVVGYVKEIESAYCKNLPFAELVDENGNFICNVDKIADANNYPLRNVVII